MSMEIQFDSAKRAEALAKRGLDFADAADAFAGPTVTIEDTRRDYREVRWITMGSWANAWSCWSGPSVARAAESFR